MDKLERIREIEEWVTATYHRDTVDARASATYFLRIARVFEYFEKTFPKAMRKLASMPRATCPICKASGIATTWVIVKGVDGEEVGSVETIDCVACGMHSYTGRRED